MSMSLKHYLGYGVTVPEEPAGFDDVYDFIEEHKEYSVYGFENPKASEPGVRIITREYEDPYLMYVVVSRDQEEMWQSDAATELPASTGLTDEIGRALATAYEEYTGKTLDLLGEVKLVSLFIAG